MKATAKVLFLLVISVLVLSSCGNKHDDPTPQIDQSMVSVNVSYVNETGALSAVLSVNKISGLNNASFGLCLGKSPKPTTATAVQKLATPVMSFSQSSYSNKFDFVNIDKSSDYYLCVYANLNGTITYFDDIIIETYAVKDIDVNRYHEVKIGNQTWLVENLRTTKYLNSDPISYVTDMPTWQASKTGSYCWANNNLETGKTHGALYSGYVVTDKRGIAMKGYHVPTYAEWQELSKFVGSDFNGGSKLMKKDASWGQTIATNETEFSAMPNGAVGQATPTSPYIIGWFGEAASFLSSDLYGSTICMPVIEKQFHALNIGGYFDLSCGSGIRLIKDKV